MFQPSTWIYTYNVSTIEPKMTNDHYTTRVRAHFRRPIESTLRNLLVKQAKGNIISINVNIIRVLCMLCSIHEFGNNSTVVWPLVWDMIRIVYKYFSFLCLPGIFSFFSVFGEYFNPISTNYRKRTRISRNCWCDRFSMKLATLLSLFFPVWPYKFPVERIPTIDTIECKWCNVALAHIQLK